MCIPFSIATPVQSRHIKEILLYVHWEMNKTIHCSTTVIAKFSLTEEQINQFLLHTVKMKGYSYRYKHAQISET